MAETPASSLPDFSPLTVFCLWSPLQELAPLIWYFSLSGQSLPHTYTHIFFISWNGFNEGVPISESEGRCGTCWQPARRAAVARSPHLPPGRPRCCAYWLRLGLNVYPRPSPPANDLGPVNFPGKEERPLVCWYQADGFYSESLGVFGGQV